ncbi:uncharacterized protein LOC124909929 [Impatiens glandulifera]|uniref:uncharacterized protein LOC124909929 n=1 Tax=Impatiens glandulifera TaxID=253017 RepID=UPI001FB134B7|nr:uncharacterized protein LOC124909929 [Impatiens glandulifera]
MPILCSGSSVKNVHIPHSKWQHQRQSTVDPSSPATKFGCMSQLNRTLNKIYAFPTPHRRLISSATAATVAATSNVATNIKYHKLKRIFTGHKQSSTNVETNGERVVQSCREVRSNCRRGNRNKNKNSCRPPPAPVNVAQMDPPLPVVVKKVRTTREDGREEVNLWKRRSNGLELKSLEITG